MAICKERFWKLHVSNADKTSPFVRHLKIL